MVTRICVIGAGPCGLSALYQFSKAQQLFDPSVPFPEIVCYEKQSTYGGMWNYTWRTGLDEFGESIPNGMYRGLWTNTPKEANEFPDYSYEEHYGKILPSHVPMVVTEDYLKAYFRRENRIFDQIHFNWAVYNVTYRPESDDFMVHVKDLVKDKMNIEYFSYVIVSSSHFSVPYCPEISGISNFTGRILHVHDFRNMQQFTDRTILVIGGSYSSEDMVLLGMKHNVKKIFLSRKNEEGSTKAIWTTSIVKTKPEISEFFSDHTVRFQDGSTATIDVVIFCTGYIHHHSYMTDDIRLKVTTKANTFYPRGLYKGILWLGDMEATQQPSANNKLFYLGMQNLAYSFHFFLVQALWTREIILGRIPMPTRTEMIKDASYWTNRSEKITCFEEVIQMGTEVVCHLGQVVKYPYNVDAFHIFTEWANNRKNDMPTFRDKCFRSLVTGRMSVPPNPPFMQATEESLEEYLQRY